MSTFASIMQLFIAPVSPVIIKQKFVCHFETGSLVSKLKFWSFDWSLISGYGLVQHIFASLPEIKQSFFKTIFEPDWVLIIWNELNKFSLQCRQQFWRFLWTSTPRSVRKLSLIASAMAIQLQSWNGNATTSQSSWQPATSTRWRRLGSLIIHEVSHIDEGVYECIAENVAGVVQASAQLTVWGEFVF